MCLKCDSRDVEVNVTWPSGPGMNERLEKVPSRYCLASENKDIGMEEDCWGFGVPSGAHSYGWFKLLLDKARISEYDIEEVPGELTNGLLDHPTSMTAKELATAYLTKMYQHCMEMLELRYTASILKVTPIDFWLTVPATWQPGAVDDTKNAAATAGFGSRNGDTLNIITEPEASGIAILTEQAEKNPELVKVRHSTLPQGRPY